MKLKWLAVSVFTLAVWQHNANAQDGGKPGTFLRLGVGARAQALGGAFSAVANDPSAAYWNAAGLAQVNHLEVIASYYRLSLDRSYYFASSAIPIGASSTIALSWIGLSVAGIEARSGNTPTPERTFSNNDHALYLSFAHRLSSFMSLGASTKLISQDLDEESAFGFGFDLSFLATPISDLTLGFNVKDVVTKTRWSSGLRERYPLMLKGGVALKISSSLLLALDAHKIGEAGAGFAAGAEYLALRLLPIRLGYTGKGVVGGAGLDFPLHRLGFKLDYAYGTDQLDATATSRLSLNIAFLNKSRSGTPKEIDADLVKARLPEDKRSKGQESPVFETLVEADPEESHQEDLPVKVQAPKRQASKRPESRKHSKDRDAGSEEQGLSFAPLSFSDEAPEGGAAVYLEAVKGTVNVMDGPGEDYEKLGTIRKGKRVKMVLRMGEWYQVEMGNGRQGWVQENSVKEIEQ